MDILLLCACALCLYKIKITKGFNNEYLSKESTTAINGFFVILVFFRHFSQYIELGKFDNIFRITDRYLSQLIVVTFLFYSGYGIMTSIMKKGNSYISALPYNRLFKVWLHFAMAIVLFIITAFAVGSEYDIPTVLLSFIAWKSVGNSAWYVFCILLLYIFTFVSFKLMGLTKLKHKNLYSVGLIIVLCGVYIIAVYHIKSSYWYNTVIAYPLGMLYKLYEPKIKAIIQKSNLTYLFSCLAGIAVFVITFMLRSKFVGFECYVVGFIIVLLLFTMKISVKNKILLWFGKYTFEIYILQRIPMILLQNVIPNKYLYFAICFAATITISVLFKLLTDAIDSKLFKSVSKTSANSIPN